MCVNRIYLLVNMLIAFLIVEGCASSSRQLKARPHAIYESLSQTYPTGIPIEIAKNEMENAGFKCELVRNGAFKHQNTEPGPIATKYVVHDNIDFLKCNRTEIDGWVTSIDSVALIIEDDLVIKMLANWDAVGP
jgi:hypothetical protein